MHSGQPFPQRKHLLCLFAVAVILVLIQTLINYMHSDSLEHKITVECIAPKLHKHKVILLWNSFFSDSGNWLPTPDFFNCSVSNCIVTSDRQFLNISSAVIFHWRNTDLKDLPIHRIAYQRWILFNTEPPPLTPRNILQGLAGKINWTATYRKDSDILTPYGWISRRKIPSAVPKPDPNRKAVCWLVSRCNAPSKRERFVETLKEFIPVDVYGKCSELRCPMKDRFECYRMLSKKYKFYLSFENSICKDYATEKVFYALSTDMVPVVMGGEKYREILPNNSYIDALSFDGPRQLADYLLSLDKDDDKYLSYFAWKKDYEVTDGKYKWTCDLCRKLNSDNDISIYRDLSDWWYRDANCYSVK